MQGEVDLISRIVSLLLELEDDVFFVVVGTHKEFGKILETFVVSACNKGI